MLGTAISFVFEAGKCLEPTLRTEGKRNLERGLETQRCATIQGCLIEPWYTENFFLAQLDPPPVGILVIARSRIVLFDLICVLTRSRTLCLGLNLRRRFGLRRCSWSLHNLVVLLCLSPSVSGRVDFWNTCARVCRTRQTNNNTAPALAFRLHSETCFRCWALQGWLARQDELLLRFWHRFCLGLWPFLPKN